MNLAKISINKPIFISCVIIALMLVGIVCFKQLPVDLFPEANIPNVSVTIIYPGAGPQEIETLITKPLEDSMSSMAGLKKITSQSFEGMSLVMAEFNQGVDSKYAEQLVRDKVNQTKSKFPDDTKEPVIAKIDLSALPIMMITLSADLPDAELFDLADRVIKPRLEQVDKVGSVAILGGRKREVQVLLDRHMLKQKEMSLLQVSNQMSTAGQNIPTGKVSVGSQDKVFRTLGDFKNTTDVSNTLIGLFGNEVPTRISDLGKVIDTVEDEKNRVYDGKNKALALQIFKQSGANTVAIVDSLNKTLKQLSSELVNMKGKPKFRVAIDGSQQIRDNVNDVYETIIIGVILTILTVFVFLNSARSTFITSLSLPISIIGTCILLYIANFSINIITLMAISVAVGLLIDDAIVVIENIFRRIELGESTASAALNGTKEIQISVIAISLVIISVFLPVSFMKGVVGQMLRQYGLTIVFAMAISLFVALTIIPMLASKLAKKDLSTEVKKPNIFSKFMSSFDRFQDVLSVKYEKLLEVVLRRPKLTTSIAILVFLLSIVCMLGVKRNFIPEFDNGEIIVNLEKEPGTSLDGMEKTLFDINEKVKTNKDLDYSVVVVGSMNQEANKGMIFLKMKPIGERKTNTSQFKIWVREQVKEFAYAKPVVQIYDITGGMLGAPVTIDILSTNSELLEKYADLIFQKFKSDPRFKDVNTTLVKGKPELQLSLRDDAAKIYGINSRTMGLELRGQVEGFTPAKFRDQGYEYDVRVRLLPEQRNVQKSFNEIYIPNINYRLVKLSNIATSEERKTVNSIDRQNRARHIQITADLTPGVGLSDVLSSNEKYFKDELKLPSEIKYSYGGTSDYYSEMIISMGIAFMFALAFIFLILSSLYESFITPFTILLSLPLALCGAFYALFITGNSLNIFGFFGIFLLIGVAGKNSILLVDFILQRMKEGTDRNNAIIQAGKQRIRPIIMTSMALIMGAVPIAIGLNPASQMRTSMGIVIIGGMISSTILTLLVIPAVFTYIDQFKIKGIKIKGLIKKRAL